MTTIRVCPICGKEYMEYPAISRRDNKIEICSACGTAEALADWIEHMEKEIEEAEDATDIF